MRTLRKALSLLLCLAMLFSFGVFSASAAPVRNQDNVDAFTDADQVGAAYEEAIDVMIGAGIINGMSTEELKLEPQGNYTRAQAAKIISYMKIGEAAAEALPVPTSDPFDDVLATMWAAKYIAYCTAEGILVGYGDGNFGPNDTLTGYQWATMLLRAVGYDENGEYEGSEWAINVAKDAIPLGLFAGDISGASNEPLNREQAILYAFNTFTGIALVSYSTLSGTYVHDNYNEFGNVGTAGIGSTTLTGTTLALSVYGLRAYEGDLLYGQVVNGDKNGNYFYVHGALDVIAENETVDNAGFRGRIWAVGSSTNVKAISGYHKTDVVLATSVDGKAITDLLNAANPAYIGYAPAGDGFTYYVDDYAGAKTTSTLEVQEAALWAAGEAYFVKAADGYYGSTVAGDLPKGTLVQFIDAAPYDQQIDKIIVQTERSYVQTDPTGRVAKEVIPGAEYETYELSTAAKMANIASRDAYNAQLKTYYEQRQEFIDLLKIHFSNVTANGVTITTTAGTVLFSGGSTITGIPYSANITTNVPFTVNTASSGASTITKDGTTSTTTVNSTLTSAATVPGVTTPLSIEQANRLIELANILGYKLYAKDLYVVPGDIQIVENYTSSTYSYAAPATNQDAQIVAANKAADYTAIDLYLNLKNYLAGTYDRQSNYSAINGAVQQPDVVLSEQLAGGDVVNVRTRIDRRIYVDKAPSVDGTLREVRRDQKLINTYNLIDTDNLVKLSAVKEWLEDGNQIKADRNGIVAPNIVITSKFIGERGTYYLGTEGYVVAYKGPFHYWDDIYFVVGVQHNRSYGDSSYSAILRNWNNEDITVPVNRIVYKTFTTSPVTGKTTTKWEQSADLRTSLRTYAEDKLAYIERVDEDYNLTSYHGIAVVKYLDGGTVKVLGYFGNGQYNSATTGKVESLDRIADSVKDTGVWSYRQGSNTLTRTSASSATSANNVSTYVVDSRTILFHIDRNGRVDVAVGPQAIRSFSASGNEVVIVPYTTAEDDMPTDRTHVNSYVENGNTVSSRLDISAYTDVTLKNAAGNSVANADMENRQLAKVIILKGDFDTVAAPVAPSAYGAISDIYRDSNGITRVRVVSALNPEAPADYVVDTRNSVTGYTNYSVIRYYKNADDSIVIAQVMGPQDFSFVESHSQTNGAANYIVRDLDNVYTADRARGLWVDRDQKQIFSIPINYTIGMSDFNKDKGYAAVAFVVPNATSSEIDEVYYVPARWLDTSNIKSTTELASALSQADLSFIPDDWSVNYAVDIPAGSSLIISGTYTNSVTDNVNYNTTTLDNNSNAVVGTTVRDDATFSVKGNYYGDGNTTVFGYLDVDGEYKPTGATTVADDATVDVTKDFIASKATTIGEDRGGASVTVDGTFKTEALTTINSGTVTAKNFTVTSDTNAQLEQNGTLKVTNDFTNNGKGNISELKGTVTVANNFVDNGKTDIKSGATVTVEKNYTSANAAETSINGKLEVKDTFTASADSEKVDVAGTLTANDVAANKAMTISGTVQVTNSSTLTLGDDSSVVITGTGTLKLAGLPKTVKSNAIAAFAKITVGTLAFTNDVTFGAVANDDTYALNADTVIFNGNVTFGTNTSVTFANVNDDTVTVVAKQYVSNLTDATATAPSGSTLVLNASYNNGSLTDGSTVGNFTVVAITSNAINSTYSVSGDTKVLKVTKKA